HFFILHTFLLSLLSQSRYKQSGFCAPPYRPKPFCKCMRLVAHYVNYNLINVSNEGACVSPCLIFVFQECVCVFVLEGDSRLLCDDPPYEVPQEGKIRCVPFVSAPAELQMFFSAGG
uniref:Uncharacterized protein n=1 Tax=Poecilia mexicana TaxID=48701 RepID=A0A3B3Z1W4_9TELE